MICPPATLIAALAREAAGSRLQVGGQDCHARPSGAHTGDISAEMLKDAGAVAVIVGHSERRADHGERDSDVKAKALAAHRAGLIGHRLHRRDGGRAPRGPDARRGRDASSPARCPTSATRRRHGRRLRAGVGDRHRPHADGGRRRRGARLPAPGAGRALRRGGRGHAHPLRRLGEARQRARACWPSATSTAPWSAGPASRPTTSSPSLRRAALDRGAAKGISAELDGSCAAQRRRPDTR